MADCIIINNLNGWLIPGHGVCTICRLILLQYIKKRELYRNNLHIFFF